MQCTVQQNQSQWLRAGKDLLTVVDRIMSAGGRAADCQAGVADQRHVCDVICLASTRDKQIPST